MTRARGVEPLISWHFTKDDPAHAMNQRYEGLERMQALREELSGLGL